MSILRVGPPRFTKRTLRRLIVTGLALCTGWLMVSLAVVYLLTHRLSARFAEPAPSVSWGRLETHRLATRDGQDIGAWFVDGRPGAASILLLHGHRGQRMSSLLRAKVLAAEGYAVLMISMRAHGDSTGNFDDIGFSGRHDVIAAVDFLEKRRPGRAVIVDGSSMGSAAAIFAAGDLAHRVSGYILESPYQDLKVAVWNRVKLALPPGMSHVAFAGLNLVAPLFLPHLDEISPVRAIAAIPDDVPVLILAGSADRHATPDEARALHDQVASHGRLVFVPGADHGDLLHSAPDFYTRTVLEFCREAARPVGHFTSRVPQAHASS